MLSSFVWSDYHLGKIIKGGDVDGAIDATDGVEVNDDGISSAATYSLAGLKGRARKDKARAVGIVALPRFEHVSDRMCQMMMVMMMVIQDIVHQARSNRVTYRPTYRT